MCLKWCPTCDWWSALCMVGSCCGLTTIAWSNLTAMCTCKPSKMPNSTGKHGVSMTTSIMDSTSKRLWRWIAPILVSWTGKQSHKVANQCLCCFVENMKSNGQGGLVLTTHGSLVTIYLSELHLHPILSMTLSAVVPIATTHVTPIHLPYCWNSY